DERESPIIATILGLAVVLRKYAFPGADQCSRFAAVVRKNDFQILEPMFANSSQTVSDGLVFLSELVFASTAMPGAADDVWTSRQGPDAVPHGNVCQIPAQSASLCLEPAAPPLDARRKWCVRLWSIYFGP